MKRFSTFIHRALYEPQTRAFMITNDVLALLTLVSVLSLILETVPRFAGYESLFNMVEYVAVSLFTLEYLLRVVVNKKHVRSYIFSFFGIIDLLAIAPTFLGLSNLTFLKTARILRILNLLRIIRLAKVARMATRKRDVEEYTSVYRLNIGIYVFALASAVIIFGTLIYIVEGYRAEFSSIPLGMLWAMKPLLGGIAQFAPESIGGEFVAIFARFVGLVLFGLLITIIGNATKKLMFGSATPESVPGR